MADKGDTHYDLPRMNRVFFLTAAVLLGTAVWMVLDDWDRSWKGYQREFREMELDRTREQVAAIETPEWLDEKRGIEEEIRDAEAELAADGEWLAAQARLSDAEGRKYKSEAGFKIAQAKYNWARYLYNQALAADPAAASDADFQNRLAALEAARKGKEDSLAVLAQAEADLATRSDARDKARAKLTELEREISLLQDKVTSLGPGVFRALRDAPALDFVAPALKVVKQVLPNLRKNYNFNTVQRVDMCATCHIAIDNPGYPDADNPLRSHPRLDLFMAPSSPHPMGTIGCTVCHEGAAETVEFGRAVHMPDSPEKPAR